ncbi:SspF [Paenibacillus mucilaginosus 3016]|uniref:SspF n=2 Tax=Paenibacillus mucilaginosus TaxID=61624 RepID=H6NSH5_9BACL|nr:SspF [Paenibacillus mucilaginosus 3016]AFH66058.1 protein SspF [Paenibacillus mucilaginosus K02]WFA22122.1 small, acid-soluble spore protein, alpha/beta type [Paenibacillus mucilaginosus]
MGRRNRRGVMSEEFKYELAKDLGFYETVEREGWGGIRTKDAGNMVKRAIQIAEQTLVRQQQGMQSSAQQGYQGQGMQSSAQQGYQGQSMQSEAVRGPSAAYAPIPVPRAMMMPQGSGGAQGYPSNPGLNVPPAYVISQVPGMSGSYMYGQRQ